MSNVRATFLQALQVARESFEVEGGDLTQAGVFVHFADDNRKRGEAQVVGVVNLNGFDGEWDRELLTLLRGEDHVALGEGGDGGFDEVDLDGAGAGYSRGTPPPAVHDGHRFHEMLESPEDEGGC